MLLILHAYCHAPDNVRRTVQAVFCADSAIPFEDDTRREIQSVSRWWLEHGVPSEAGALHDVRDTELCRLQQIVHLNGHSRAEGLGETVGLFLVGSKFTHECISPNCVFHVTATGSLAHRALRRIDDGEILTVDYCGAFGNCSTRLRREHLLRSKLFLCECTACASADATRRFPCPACCPRREDGLLRRLDADSPDLTEAQPTVVPRARGRECAWVCDGCQRQFSDRDVDRPVHLGAVNRMPQLHAARTLFAAERLLESAVHNLLVHSSRQSDRLRCSAPTSAHAHTLTARSHAYARPLESHACASMRRFSDRAGSAVHRSSTRRNRIAVIWHGRHSSRDQSKI